MVPNLVESTDKFQQQTKYFDKMYLQWLYTLRSGSRFNLRLAEKKVYTFFSLRNCYFIDNFNSENEKERYNFH